MKSVLILLVVIALAAGGWFWRDRLPWPAAETASVAAAPREPPPKSVAAQTVGLSALVERIRAVGTVEARDAVILTVETAGIVREILFEHGAEVEAGAVLLRLGDREERAQVAAARTGLEAARKAHERATQLRRNGTVSQQVLDDAAAALDAARAALAVAEARLAEREVRAPFAGRLGFRQVSPGAYLRPGDPITTLDDLSRVYVDFAIPEPRMAALAPGQAVAVRSAAYPGTRFEGRVASIAPRVDPVSRQVAVRAEIPNDGELLRPGQLAEVELSVGSREAVLVPATAVVATGRQSFVFVVGPGKRAERRTVETGERRDGAVEITAGLTPGETVVVEGATKLDGGDAVSLVPAMALGAPQGAGG